MLAITGFRRNGINPSDITFKAKDVSMLSCNGNVLVGKLAELLVQLKLKRELQKGRGYNRKRIPLFVAFKNSLSFPLQLILSEWEEEMC